MHRSVVIHWKTGLINLEAPFCDIAREVFEISNDGEISLKSKIDIQKQAEIRRNQSMTASEDIEQDVIQFQPRAAPRGATLQLSHRPRHNKSHMAPLSFYYSYADTTLILAWHTSVIALVLLFLSFRMLHSVHTLRELTQPI